jgi:PmbA protein
VVFEGGSKSREEIQRNVKRGIFVTGFIGGNSNSTTGDFSFGVSGMLIENGVLVRPVYEMNISGNMKDFWNELFEIGNDPYPYSDARTPTLHFRNIQFSGV